MSAEAAAQPPVPDPEAATRERVIAVEGKGTLSFLVADAADGAPPVFCLAVRKSGSTMLNRIVIHLARRNGVNPVDVPGTFFRSGMNVADWLRTDLSSVIAPGNAYVGFRSYPTGFAGYPSFRTARKIFMFRDPRDALVSQYFSDAYSHSLPSRETETGAKAAEAFERKRQEALSSDIETYVLRHARSFDNTLLAFAPALDDPTCLTLRYEEHVFQKKRLIHKILGHYGWTCMPAQVEGLLKIVDTVPESEDVQRFIRRVIPGDHRNKLGPETIRRLNNIMRESMAMFDYH